MIQWGEHEKVMVRLKNNLPTNFHHYFQRSVDPPGYIINLVPFNELCHLQCLYIPEGGGCVHIGTISNIPRTDSIQKRRAAAKLRDACEAHATGASPSASAAGD